MYRHSGLKLDDPGGALGGTTAEPTIRTPRTTPMVDMMAGINISISSGECRHVPFVVSPRNGMLPSTHTATSGTRPF
jgi:hypothetical protein